MTTRIKRAELKGPPNRLPVPVTPAAASALPVLTEHGQLEADLKAFARAIDDDDIATMKATLTTIEQLRSRWRAVDQPANYDQIATEVLRLTTVKPSAGNIDQGMLADTLCEDLAEMRPTSFALVRGCRAHRLDLKSEFLSLPRLANEIRRAEGRGCRYREALAENLPDLIRSAEEEQRRRAQKHKEYLRKKRTEYENLLRDFGPHPPEGFLIEYRRRGIIDDRHHRRRGACSR
jgi:hypothetical protein